MKTLATAGTFHDRPGFLPFDIVIRDKGEGEHQRYVVHLCVHQENGAKGYQDGGYHSLFPDAWEDFDNRTLRAYTTNGAPS